MPGGAGIFNSIQQILTFRQILTPSVNRRDFGQKNAKRRKNFQFSIPSNSANFNSSAKLLHFWSKKYLGGEEHCSLMGRVFWQFLNL